MAGSWNPDAHRKLVKAFVDAGVTLSGQEVDGMENLYRILEKELSHQWEMVKGRARKNSNGPGGKPQREESQEEKERAAMIQRIADILGTTVEKLTKEEKPMKTIERVSEFNKKAIFDTYYLLKNYLHDNEMENENCFCEMYSQFEMRKIAMPQSIYEKIADFIDEKIAPIIYQRKEVFAACYAEDIGSFNEDGVFHVKDEEAGERLCVAFLAKVFEIEQDLDAFAMRELYPVLNA